MSIFLKIILVIAILMNLNSCNRTSKIKIACVGDSITEGLLIEEPERYPATLQKILGEKYLVQNFGVSGATATSKGNFPYILQGRFQEALDFFPNIVVIMLGTNDAKDINFQYKDDFPADYLQLISRFQELPTKPEIYICYAPFIKGNGHGVTMESIIEINDLITKLNKKQKLPTVQTFKPFIICKDCYLDNIHPNAKGSTLIAEMVAKKVLGID